MDISKKEGKQSDLPAITGDGKNFGLLVVTESSVK